MKHDTPTACPLCGDARPQPGCRVCRGVGVVDAAVAQRWASSQPTKASSTTISLADLVAELVARLRARGGAPAVELATVGQGLLDSIAAWRVDPADGATRRETYARVGPWQRLALELLAKPR